MTNQKGIAFIPILIWTVILLFVGTAAVKNGVVKINLSGNQPLIQKVDVTSTPSPTLIPTTIPTSIKNPQGSKTIDIPTSKSTPQPVTPQKVPVVLSHNGLTYYCDPSVVQSVKDASTSVKSSTNDYIQCQDSQQANTQNCVNGCKNITLDICNYEMTRTSYGYSSYDDCVTRRGQESLDCIDKCYNGDLAKLGRQVCEIGSSNATNSLNGLLDKYCR